MIGRDDGFTPKYAYLAYFILQYTIQKRLDMW